MPELRTFNLRPHLKRPFMRRADLHICFLSSVHNGFVLLVFGSAVRPA